MTRRAMAAGLLVGGCAATLGPAETSPDPELLSFPATDGVPASAYGYGAGARGVVLVPGAHGVGETWDPQARRLAQAGFRVFALDYRGLGRASAVPQDDANVHHDVLGAVRRLREDGAGRVHVVGASWGGTLAARAALAEPGAIDGIVFLASAPEAPEDLGGRKLFILADNDRSGSGRPRLDTIRLSYERTPDPKELVVVSGSAHAQFLFLTPQGRRVMAEIERFLSAPA